MQRALNKYKIGLLVMAVFTLVLSIIVLAQASATKQDVQTYKDASKVADKLNDYVDSHGVPSSLQAARITDVPESVTYTKLSRDSYKFCVNYKAASGGFDATDVETSLLTAAYGGGSSAYDDYYSKYQPSSLYLETSHKKGENCQTVKTYDYTSYYDDYSTDDSSSSSSSSSTSDSSCKYKANMTTAETDAYYSCLEKEYSVQQKSKVKLGH